MNPYIHLAGAQSNLIYGRTLYDWSLIALPFVVVLGAIVAEYIVSRGPAKKR